MDYLTIVFIVLAWLVLALLAAYVDSVRKEKW